ncbi:F-box-like domain superfamily [Arabidopsis thaliana x Arabidopsis arenosa]|uniref:F-box-like domain superfamily n=1 Tax=Arabidopsis thaliana x Arabidopsis arenosa TaxID=1240361 RepID=A0A8T1YS59_9BRAS|nr:F-box-like domain superfamily [Arabidopsis thaliana x Arabidopsis arenosa]
MENDFREEDLATVAIGNPSHRFSRPLKLEQASDSIDGVDSISSLPDDILHCILSYIPTNFAIRTSVLSKRWRHVWSESPHLSFDQHRISAKSINETLNNYRAIKIISFHLFTRLHNRIHFVNSWIEFAISHNAEKLSLDFRDARVRDYKFPGFFYTNSSVKQLLINSGPAELIPSCTVSWTSLKYLSLIFCKVSNESFPKILSGCPLLESLTLHNCDSVKYLDLSKSLYLRRLDIICCNTVREPMKIVAPHIHYLRLRGQCTLLDVSSLTEADVDSSDNYLFLSFSYYKSDSLMLVMVQAMLEKLQNVEKLTLGVDFLRLHGVPLPKLKVKTLTLETMIMRPVVLGIARLVQNSPQVKKITIYTTQFSTVLDKCDSFLELQNLNPNQGWRSIDVVFPTSWDSKVPEPELMVSFIELLLANTITLETLVVRLGSYTDDYRSRFEEQFQIALTLSHNNEVSIVLK